ncbi:hypothetical protein [Pseudovibrio ascidiaceicola]|nr:hypothetical protein [Pseudovibrio ascidiaceicola]
MISAIYDYIPDWAVDWVPGAAEERTRRTLKTVLAVAGGAYLFTKLKK